MAQNDITEAAQVPIVQSQEDDKAVNELIEETAPKADLDDPTGTKQWSTMKEEANRGEAFEHSLSLWQSLKYYRKAALWSGAISLSIIMEAFDASMGGSWAMFQFRKSFGSPTGDGDYQVTAAWQTGIPLAGTLGQFFGLILASWLADRIGYRWTMIGNMMFMIPAIAILVFAQNKLMLLWGQIVCGIPWGAFQLLSETYASEVVPLSLRAYMTGWINFCWVFGGLIGGAVPQGTQGIPSAMAWRIPYMCQWVWPIPMSILLYLAPESPWWAVRKNKYDLAQRSILRLANKDEEERVSQTLANMIRTVEFEREEARQQANASWFDLFRGSDRRRTEIAFMAWACQSLCGSGFVGNTAYIMEQAGISQTVAFRFSYGSTVITVAANILAFWFFSRFGRRTIYLVGQSLLFLGLIIIGSCGVAVSKGLKGSEWAQASFQVIWNFLYVAFLGPPCYAIVGETASLRLRTKSVAFARTGYFIVGIPMNYLISYSTNPTAWNWQGKAAYIFCVTCGIGLVWTYFRLPEFKDRSYYEIDILFVRGVSARKFKSTVVEEDADDHIRAAREAGQI